MAYGDYYNPTNKTVNAGDIVYASDINDINAAIDAGFEQVAADITAVALGSADISEAWASNPQGVRPDILIAEYSSKAYAQEAREAAYNTNNIIHKADGTTVTGAAGASAYSSYVGAQNYANSASSSASAAGAMASTASIKAAEALASEIAADASADAALASQIAADASAVAAVNTLSSKANNSAPAMVNGGSWNAVSGSITIANSQTTGSVSIGGQSGTGGLTLGKSTKSQSLSISTGATESGEAKSISIGTGGVSGSTTNISIGSYDGSSCIIDIYGNSNIGSNATDNITLIPYQTSGTAIIGGTSGTGTVTIGRSTNTQTVNLASGANASGKTKTVNIGTGGSGGSTTNVNIGATSGTSTTTLNGTVNASTQTQGDSSTKVATTAFVNGEISGLATSESPILTSGGYWNIGLSHLYLGNDQSNGGIFIGGPSAGGNIHLGRSTTSQIIGIGIGGNTSGQTKTINLGTGGVSGSITSITIGATSGTSTTTLNGTVTATTLSASDNSTKVATTAFVRTSTKSVITKAVTGGIVALTADEVSNSAVILTGVLASALTITIPSGSPVSVMIKNNTTGAFSTTVKVAGGAVTSTLAQGSKDTFIVISTELV